MIKILFILLLTSPAMAGSSAMQNTISSGTRSGWVVPTQDLLDSGRSVWVASVTAIAGVTTEGVISLTGSTNFVARATASSLSVTAGKRLRLQALGVVWRNPTAVSGSATVRLRAIGSGTCNATSPVLYTVAVSSTPPTLGSASSVGMSFMDGIELSGTQSICVSQLSQTTAAGLDVTLIGFEY